ncbi:hypothetical protein [Vibrio cholerae]|uniref:hypothetical protein n=1 Tax=Vibrio cholerae TaxID=666 RepID=UPI0015CF1BB5|nr:hypothetical protein [Vibrio cholerae]
MKRRTIWLFLFLTACSVNGETNWDTKSFGWMYPLFATNSDTTFNHLSVSLDSSPYPEVLYEPDVSLSIDFPSTILKNSTMSKDGSHYFFDSGLIQVDYSNSVVESKLDTNQTSIYIQSRNSNILYISSFISAIGLMLSAVAIILGRLDKDRDHKKGVIDEFWYRTILIPELRANAKNFVTENLLFWESIRKKPSYSLSKSQVFIEEKFNSHFHKVLMVVETIKLIDLHFNQGEEVQALFEEVEDIVVDAIYSMAELSFVARQQKIKDVVDCLNELESKLTKELMMKHHEFSGVKV